jgi:hypothetical protein
LGQAESLEGFLGEWPGSRWAAQPLAIIWDPQNTTPASLRLPKNWKRSWELARGSKDPRMRALAHQSVAQLARMHARLGKDRRIEASFGAHQQARGLGVGPPDA